LSAVDDVGFDIVAGEVLRLVAPWASARLTRTAQCPWNGMRGQPASGIPL